MAREVNVYTSNWRATGNDISVPQYAVDVTIKWIKDDGTSAERSETLRFPNFLQNLTNTELKEWLTELMLQEVRKRLVAGKA